MEWVKDIVTNDKFFPKISPLALQKNVEIKISEFIQKSHQNLSQHAVMAQKMEYYNIKKLNKEQHKLLATIDEQDCVLIQAGPGTGKTFSMVTYTLNRFKNNKTTHVMIYKNDLLTEYTLSAFTKSVCGFILSNWNMQYYNYLSFDRYCCGKLSVYEYMQIIIFIAHKFMNSEFVMIEVLLIDEYLLVNKMILLGLLIAAKRVNVKIILCGDKNQLPTITRNKQDNKLTNYEIGSRFANSTITLNKNMRCVDDSHNELLWELGRCASEKKINNYCKALISAMLFNNLTKPQKIFNMFLASTHRSITEYVHTQMCKDKYPNEFYHIICTNKEGKEPVGKLVNPNVWITQIGVNYCRTEKVDKFLPYLPLIIGLEYYVHTRSELAIAKLKTIDLENGILVLTYLNTGHDVEVKRGTNNSVIFEGHYNELIGGGGGKIYGFPIYPSNWITLHMCQGRTISSNLDIDLRNASFHGSYVALSRATNPENINSLSIDDELQFQIATIINFESYINYKAPSFKEVKNCLDSNMYKLHKIIPTREIVDCVSKYIITKSSDERSKLRMELINLVDDSELEFISEPMDDDDEYVPAATMLDYIPILTKAASMNKKDGLIWFKEISEYIPIISESEFEDTKTYYTLCELMKCPSTKIKNTKDYIVGNSTIGFYDEYLSIVDLGSGQYKNTFSNFAKQMYIALEKGPLSLDWLIEIANKY